MTNVSVDDYRSGMLVDKEGQSYWIIAGVDDVFYLAEFNFSNINEIFIVTGDLIKEYSISQKP